MNVEPQIRAATLQDCLAIAGLYRIASDGVADYIWSKLAEPGEDILDVGARRYAREDSPFGYLNCTVVEFGGEIIGMLSAFRMIVDPDEEETDPVLMPYAQLEVDQSFYICGIALYPEYRGRGLGSRLLDLAMQRGRELGCTQLSLIVFEQNADALRLYERLGYREVDRAPVVPHPMIHFTGDAILMVRDIDGT